MSVKGRRAKPAVAISGIWLRSNSKGNVEVLAEVDGVWRLVMTEALGGMISHITETKGILRSPKDLL